MKHAKQSTHQSTVVIILPKSLSSFMHFQFNDNDYNFQKKKERLSHVNAV
jgi:hypothetical protein